jgi:hypothetical protein
LSLSSSDDGRQSSALLCLLMLHNAVSGGSDPREGAGAIGTAAVLAAVIGSLLSRLDTCRHRTRGQTALGAQRL